MRKYKNFKATVVNTGEIYSTYWSFFSENGIMDLLEDNIYVYGNSNILNEGMVVDVLFIGKSHYNKKIAVVRVNEDMHFGLNKIALIGVCGLELIANIKKEKVVKLNETVEMMNSEDFKERFKAEYYQLKIRMEGLSDMLFKYKNAELSFTPKCSYDLLNGQFKSMDMYASFLEERALIEGIEL